MRRRGWGGVGLVSGWQVTASVCFYAIFAATAFVRQDFGVSRTLMGVVVTTIVLGYTVGLLPMGALVDAVGERLPLILGLALVGIGVLGVVVAPTYGYLLLSLFVLGVGYATSMPATNRAIVAVSPEGHRSLALNVKQVGVTAGSGLSAIVITGVAATRYGWRAGFVVVAVAAVVVIGIFWWRYPATDGTGSLSFPNVRALFRDARYGALVLGGFFFGVSVFTTTGYVVPHLTESVGSAVGFAGLVLAAVQVSGSVGRLGGGALVDRLPGTTTHASAVVLLFQGVGATVCFLAVTVVSSNAAALVAFVALGFFILGFTGIYYSCLTGLVADEQIGAATAIGQVIMNVGGLLAPPAFGYLADVASYDAGWAGLAASTLVATAVTGWLVLHT